MGPPRSVSVGTQFSLRSLRPSRKKLGKSANLRRDGSSRCKSGKKLLGGAPRLVCLSRIVVLLSVYFSAGASDAGRPTSLAGGNVCVLRQCWMTLFHALPRPTHISVARS